MHSEYALSRTAAVNKVQEQIKLLKVGFDCITVVISNLALPLPDESHQLFYFFICGSRKFRKRRKAEIITADD